MSAIGDPMVQCQHFIAAWSHLSPNTLKRHMVHRHNFQNPLFFSHPLPYMQQLTSPFSKPFRKYPPSPSQCAYIFLPLVLSSQFSRQKPKKAHLARRVLAQEWGREIKLQDSEFFAGGERKAEIVYRGSFSHLTRAVKKIDVFLHQ